MSEKITAIIVDDENRSIINLQILISTYCPELSIVATADTIDEAYNEIERLKPSIVFLDIDMPPQKGFDLLKKYQEIPFEVIFVTAFDFYAIEAIKFSALDYLLKPIDVDELKSAVKKAFKKIKSSQGRTTQYFSIADDKDTDIKRIVINSMKGMELIELKDIIYIKSNNVYSIFHLQSGKQVTCSQRSIKDYEEMLAGKGFFRTHRSYIINLTEIAVIDHQEGILLKNKEYIPLAESRKSALKKKLI